MKLSIVTPSYGQAKFIESSISSVLNSYRVPEEYYVIDGGSNDGSLEIIRKYAPHLTGWLSEPDRGQADAINKGFARCTGDVFAWLNSDDRVKPDAYVRVMKAFEEDPELLMVYGDVESIDENGVIFNRQTFRQYSIRDFACFNIISQPAVFFRRSAWLNAGPLDDNYQYLLDHQFWLRIISQGKCLYIPQTLAQARYHTNAKNIARAADFGEEAFRIVEWMRTQSTYQNLFQHEEKRILAGAHSIDAFYLVEAGRYPSALKAVLKAARYDVKSIKRNYKRTILSIMGFFGLRKLKALYDRARKKIPYG